MTKIGTKSGLATITDRRGLLRGIAGAGIALVGAHMLPGVVQAQASQGTAQKIADHFTNVKTMMGEFVQFGPRGEQTGGKFFIQRPGLLRFNYEPPADFRVISDGSKVALINNKMKTADLYSLRNTPLKLILDEEIDLSGNKVKGVREEADLTTIQLADRNLFGNATIAMMFDPKTYDLRQWTITDAQGKDTTVMIFNVQEGVTFDPSVFKIDYQRVNAMTQPKQGQQGN
jgi:outer membrane lipoprotein-sorting protein